MAGVAGNLAVQRSHALVEPTLGAGTLSLKTMSEEIHFRLTLGDADAGFQAADDGEQVVFGGDARSMRERKRNPKLGLARESETTGHFCGPREIESWGHYANDGIALAIQFQGAAENCGVRAKTIAPQLISEDDGVGVAGLVFVGGKGTAQ